MSSLAKKSIKENKSVDGKILWLLADACSMRIKPSDMNEPFINFLTMDSTGNRSALADDFQVEDVAFFAKIANKITTPKLRARIADIVWVIKRDHKLALLAIDSYVQISLDVVNWQNDGKECWERAIQLCLMLNKQEYLKSIENKLVTALLNTTHDDGFWAYWIADLLLKHKQGREQQTDIAKKLEDLALDLYLDKSKNYFQMASEWYKQSENLDKSIDMIARLAEEWVVEGDTRDNLTRIHSYEKAIQTYRKIPKQFRISHDVANSLLELHKKLTLAGKNSQQEMKCISSDSIDITGFIQKSKKIVSGKNVSDALLTLANIYHVQVTEIKKIAKENQEIYIGNILFPRTFISSDGRVIAKESNMNDDEKIWINMVQNYSMELGLVVQANILPALSTIRQEHRLREIDFYSITSQSPIVPTGRERLIAKALYAGYDNDFIKRTSTFSIKPNLQYFTFNM